MRLFNYQRDIIKSKLDKSAFGLLMGTGTGKTITSLYRATLNPTPNLLILCPRSVIEQWSKVIKDNFSQYDILEFSKNSNGNTKNEEIRNIYKTSKNTIIVNYQILHKLDSLLEVVDDSWTIIVDESHKIKDVGTTRNPVKVTAFALKLSKRTSWKILLTATPTQKNFGGYADWYSQLYFLGAINYEFKTFSDRYIKYTTNYYKGKYPVKVICGYKNTDVLDELLKEWFVYYNPPREENETEHIKINFPAPKDYNKIKKTRIYEDITMQNSARIRLGLKTLCTGIIFGQDYYNERISYEHDTVKIDWLKEFLENTNEVVAIYYQYNVELENLKKLIKDIDKTYVVINGETKDKYSEVNDNDFQVLLGQFDAASGSLDGLQFKCNTIVLFSLPESSIVYNQMLGRIDRVGQTKTPTYYYLVRENTIEQKIYDMIEQKIEFSEEVLNKLVL